MKRIDLESFEKILNCHLVWKKGSRLAVLFERRGYWGELSEDFLEELSFYYDVLFLEEHQLGNENISIESWQKQREQLNQWKPDGLIGMGGFSLLQKTCWLRESLEEAEIPILLFSGKDRWQAFFRETLWIRGIDGRTCYWGYRKQHEKDLMVLAEDFMEEHTLQTADHDLERTIYQWKKLFRRFAAEENEEDGDNESKRDLCEELAEPLRILYGIPMEIGNCFALLYLYRQLSAEQDRLFCQWLELDEGCAGWYLEELAQRCCREEITGIVLPERDVPLLTEMAMEGIENYPLGQQIGWEQVEEFYGELCWRKNS